MLKLRKIFASLATFALMLSWAPSVAFAQTFTDVSTSSPYYDAVESGVAAGYFTTARDHFYPDLNATRAEVAKTLAIAANLGDGTPSGHTFTDVPAENPFYMYIMKLANNGVISLNAEYNPDTYISREEFTKMVVGAMGYEEDLTGAPRFPDVGANSGFYTFIHTAYNNGIVQGYADGTFRPGAYINRGQIALMLTRALGADYGEADHLMVTASATEVAIGDVVVINASIRDAQGRLVRNAEGSVTFSAPTGVLEATSVPLSFGAATTTLSSEFAIEDLEITANYNDWTESVMVSFVVGDDRLGLYLIDNAGYADSDTYGIITLVDTNNVPINGENENFVVDVVKGDMIIQDVASTALDGVYMFELSNGTIGATAEENVVQVTHTTDGLVAQAKFDVEDVVMTVRVGTPDISTEEDTAVILYLNQADGTPIVGAQNDIEITVLNSEQGELNTSTASQELTVNPDVLTSKGGYIAQFVAGNREANAILKVRYFGQTPIDVEEVEIGIHPYDITMMVPQNTVNTYNGYFDVILLVKDVNGMPVNDYPVAYFDLDVITGATVTDPAGDAGIGTDGDGDYKDTLDWSTFPAGGVYTTRVLLNKSRVSDSTIQIVANEQRTINADIEVSATVSATDPIINDISYFEANTAQVGEDEFVVFSLVDSEGSPVTNLLKTDVIFETTTGVQTALAGTETFVELPGGLYFAEVPTATTTVGTDRMIISDEDIEFANLAGSLIDDAGVYTMVSDNSITGSDGDNAYAAVAVEVVGGFAQAAGPTVTLTLTSDNSALVAAAGGAISTTTTGADVADFDLLTSIVVEEVETATLTLTASATPITRTASVAPFDIEVVSLDGNDTFVDTTYALVLTSDRDGKLVNAISVASPPAAGNTTNLATVFPVDPITLDINGAVDASEVTVSTFTTGLDGIVATNDDDEPFVAAAAINSPDHLVATNDVVPAGMWAITIDRSATNDSVDEEVEIEVQAYSKDEQVDTFASTMKDVTIDAWLESATSIVRPDADTLNAGQAETVGSTNLYALVYNDHGVLDNVQAAAPAADGNAVLTYLTAETGGDASLDNSIDNGGNYDATLNALATGLDTMALNGFQSGVTNVLDGYKGIRWITVETGNNVEEADITVYPTSNDNNVTELTLDIKLPEANLVTLPEGAYFPDDDNDTANFVLTVLNQYGNPMSGLSVSGTTPAIAIEVSGDPISLTEVTGTSNVGADPLGSFYIGDFTSDDEDDQDVTVIWNDDDNLVETTIRAIFINDGN